MREPSKSASNRKHVGPLVAAVLVALWLWSDRDFAMPGKSHVGAGSSTAAAPAERQEGAVAAPSASDAIHLVQPVRERADATPPDEFYVVAVGQDGRAVAGVEVLLAPVRSRADVPLPTAQQLDLAPGLAFADAGLLPTSLLTEAVAALPESQSGARPDGAQMRATTSADGRATFALPAAWRDAPGLRVQARHGVWPVTPAVQAVARDAGRAIVRCADGAAPRRLTVVGDRGQPIADATIWKLRQTGGDVLVHANLTSRALGQTDAAGGFDMPRFAEDPWHAIAVVAEGWRARTVTVDELLANDAHTVALDRGIRWQLALRDAEDRPVAGCRCLAMTQSPLAPDWFPGMLPAGSASRCGMVSQNLVSDADGIVRFSGWPGDAKVLVQVGDTERKVEVVACDLGETIKLFTDHRGRVVMGLRVAPTADAKLQVRLDAAARPAVIVEGGFSGSAKGALLQFCWSESFRPYEAAVARDDRSFRVVHPVFSEGGSFELRSRIGGSWRSLGTYQYREGMKIAGLVLGGP